MLSEITAFIGGVLTVLLLEAIALGQILEPLRETIERLAAVFTGE